MSEVIPIHNGRRSGERERAADARDGKPFTTVRRGGRIFRVYDSAPVHDVFELPGPWTPGTPAA
jgi:hypothetical protein